MFDSMSKTVTMEVFRAGKQTDSAGNSKEWTEKDLDKIIEKTNSIGEDVPATLGHPKDNSPAFGWFGPSKLVRKGKVLFAELKDVTKEFGEALKNKNFKNRSIALRNDFSLRHIAFLGGVMPAVKGLSDFKFNEKDEFQEFEFAMDSSDTVFAFRTIGRIFQGLRDKIISKDGVETADKALNQFDIDSLKSMMVDPTENNNPIPEVFNESQDEESENGGDMEFKEQFEAEKAKNAELAAQLEESKKESAEFKEAAEKSEKELNEFKETREKEIKEAKEVEFNEFAEKLIKEKKVLPAQKNVIVQMCKTLDGQESIDFNEGDESIKKTPLDIYKAGLEENNTSGLFGEKFENHSDVGASVESAIANKVNDLMEKTGKDFNECSRKLMEDEPELFNGYNYTKKI